VFASSRKVLAVRATVKVESGIGVKAEETVVIAELLLDKWVSAAVGRQESSGDQAAGD